MGGAPAVDLPLILAADTMIWPFDFYMMTGNGKTRCGETKSR